MSEIKYFDMQRMDHWGHNCDFDDCDDSGRYYEDERCHYCIKHSPKCEYCEDKAITRIRVLKGRQRREAETHYVCQYHCDHIENTKTCAYCGLLFERYYQVHLCKNYYDIPLKSALD